MKSDKNPKRLLSVQDAADYLARSEGSLRKLIFNKQIAVLRARDGSIRITVAELDAFASGVPLQQDQESSSHAPLKAVSS